MTQAPKFFLLLACFIAVSSATITITSYNYTFKFTPNCDVMATEQIRLSYDTPSGYHGVHRDIFLSTVSRGYPSFVSQVNLQCGPGVSTCRLQSNYRSGSYHIIFWDFTLASGSFTAEFTLTYRADLILADGGRNRFDYFMLGSEWQGISGFYNLRYTLELPPPINNPSPLPTFVPPPNSTEWYKWEASKPFLASGSVWREIVEFDTAFSGCRKIGSTTLGAGIIAGIAIAVIFGVGAVCFVIVCLSRRRSSYGYVTNYNSGYNSGYSTYGGGHRHHHHHHHHTPTYGGHRGGGHHGGHHGGASHGKGGGGAF